MQTGANFHSNSTTHNIKILKKPKAPFTGNEAPFVPRSASMGAIPETTPISMKVNSREKSPQNLTRESVFEMVNNLLNGGQENKAASTVNKTDPKASGCLNRNLPDSSTPGPVQDSATPRPIQDLSTPRPGSKQMTLTFIPKEPNCISQLIQGDQNYTFVPSQVGQSTCITMFAEKPSSKTDSPLPLDNTHNVQTLPSTITTASYGDTLSMYAPKQSMYPACSPSGDFKLVQVPPAIQAQLEIQAGMKPSFNAQDLEQQSNMRVANAVTRKKFPSSQASLTSRPIQGRKSDQDNQCEPLDYSTTGIDKNKQRDRSPREKQLTSDCQQNVRIQKMPSPIYIPPNPYSHTMVQSGKTWEDFQRENIGSHVYTSMWQQMCNRAQNSATQNIAHISSILKEDSDLKTHVISSSPESGPASPESDCDVISDRLESPEHNRHHRDPDEENVNRPKSGVQDQSTSPKSHFAEENSNARHSQDLYTHVPIQPHQREVQQPNDLPRRPVRGTPKKLVQCMTMPRRQPEYLNRSLVLNLAQNILEHDSIQREENESKKIFLRMLLQTILNTVIAAQTAHRTLRCISMGGVNIEAGTLAFIKSQLEALIHTTVGTVNSLSIKMNNDLLTERKSAAGHDEKQSDISGKHNQGNMPENREYSSSQMGRDTSRNQNVSSGGAKASLEIRRKATDSRLLAQVGEALNNGILTNNTPITRPAQTLTQKTKDLNGEKIQKNGECKSSEDNRDIHEEKDSLCIKGINTDGNNMDSRMVALGGTALDNMTHTPLDNNRYWKKRMLNKTTAGQQQPTNENSQTQKESTQSQEKRNTKNGKSKRKRNSKGSPNGNSPPILQDQKKTKASVILVDCMNRTGLWANIIARFISYLYV